MGPIIQRKPPIKLPSWLTPNLSLGSVLWLLIGLLAAVGLLQLALMEYIFLLAPLLIVPLGLGLVDVPAGARLQAYLYWLAKTLQPVGAISAVATFFWARGWMAGALAAVWLGVTLLGVLKVVVLSVVRYHPAQLLLSISGLSVTLGLGLIYLYAIGEFTGYTFITIPQMVQLHGVANALGFSLCGLLGWNLLRDINS